MSTRYIVVGKGVNAFIDERSFKSKKYAEKKKELLEEFFTDEFSVEEILVEDKDAVIASLKAQLKTKDRLIEIYSNSNNWETPSGQTGWFEPCEEDELFIKELETVKARSV